MDLYQALRRIQGKKIAFVGSGGKTTALFQLARLMEPPVIAACSTHMGIWQTNLADHHFVLERAEQVEAHTKQLEGVTLFTGPSGTRNRLQGLAEDSLAELRLVSDDLGLPLLIEADGSRQLPLKAPGPNEPLIPAWVDAVVVVAGLSGLGNVLDSDHVHRPERFAELSGLGIGETIHEAALAQVLMHPEGGLKNISAGANKILLLNQVDNELFIKSGMRIANLVSPVYPSIYLTSLTNQKAWRVIEPTAGIILAGGEASRFGYPKMLMPWKGKTIIRQIAETVLAAHLEPVIIILGAYNQSIREALAGLPVTFCDNPDWQRGQSESIRQGVEHLPPQAGSAAFLMADQPQITPELIEALVERHQETLAPIVAPRVKGQRSNPVLFDRVTFPALQQLQGDTGGRTLFPQYPPDFLDWDDPNVLLDIDTLEDYDRLQGMA